MRWLILFFLIFISSSLILTYSIGSKIKHGTIDSYGINSSVTIDTKQTCGNVVTPLPCPLQPGDILLKRQLTRNTFLISPTFHLFFTHSALYLGNNLILEAKGFDSVRSNEVRIISVNSTEWNDSHMEHWAVLRTNIRPESLSSLNTIAKNYADSPHVHFGFSSDLQNIEKISCSQLIWKVYKEAGYSLSDIESGIITPDYLYSLAFSKNPRLHVIYGH